MPAPSIRAGVRYGAEAFGLGFLLGIVRITALVPAMGELPAVLCETPVMLLAMGWRATVLARYHALATIGSRAAMGGIGFALLMGCELGLGMMLGLSPGKWLSNLTTPAGLTGLTAQIIFATLPVWVRPFGRPDASV